MNVLQTLVYSFLLILIFTGLTFAQNYYIYPDKGQSQSQTEKDKSQCHTWAVGQTGFDPTAPYYPSSPPPTQPAPKSGVVEGAAKGAILGTVVGAISGNTGKGAAIGASSGALVGVFNKYDESKERKYYEKQYNEQQSREYAAKRSNYDRAYTACLEGRGYTVK